MMTKLTPSGRRILFGVVLAYTLAYFNRLNLSAALTGIIHDLGITPSAAGLAPTCFAVIYACGQLVTGSLADRFDPVRFILTGLIGSVLCNLALGVIGQYWALVALCAGLLMYLFILGPGQKMSKIVSIILGSALVSLVCLACYRLRLSNDFSHMIIGSIIPLIPGIPFTNGIRDIANGDYLSGIVRMLDALLGFLCIAIGVGIVMSAYQWIFGGFVL